MKMMHKIPEIMTELENNVVKHKDVIKPDEHSPERFDIMGESVRRFNSGPKGFPWIAPIMVSILTGVNRSFKSVKENPEPAKNGVALYPPLAQAAGLGWMGHSGLLITPEHGPRVRLTAVFTSITNLPCTTENHHSWVDDFCSSCKICTKECPGNAILEKQEDHPNGRVTWVDTEKCFPYFHDYYDCSICISVCPFNSTGYERIKESWNKSR